MTTFRGRTEDSSAPILGAGYWAKGQVIVGVVEGSFETKLPDQTKSRCWTIKLLKAEAFEGRYLSPKFEGRQNLERVSIGALKGFEMAVRASGAGELKTGDKVHIRCSGTTETYKGNDMVNFEVEVDRP